LDILIAIIEDYLFIHTVITHIYSDFYTTGNTEEPAETPINNPSELTKKDLIAKLKD